jgi:hypothetical protein
MLAAYARDCPQPLRTTWMRGLESANAMYQPQTPLIETSPRFRNRRLAEIELGQLVLLREESAQSAATLGIRGDALSRRGDVLEGVFRLSAHAVTFERRALDETLTALEIDYDLQADLAGPMSLARRPGDLLVRTPGSLASLIVGGPWDGRPGLLDLASAVARPYADEPPGTSSVCMSWRLVDRNDRSRILYQRQFAERAIEATPRQRAGGEESD